MRLVDTANWIELLRDQGRPEIKQELEILIEDGEAAWCDLIRIELWNGAGGDQDLKALRELETVVPSLDINAEVWALAVALTKRIRGKGLTIPATDILIAACSEYHGVEVLSLDSHFKLIAKHR